MNKIVLDRNKRKLIDSIFEHYTYSGKCYSIHFADTDETVMLWIFAIQKH